MSLAKVALPYLLLRSCSFGTKPFNLNQFQMIWLGCPNGTLSQPFLVEMRLFLGIVITNLALPKRGSNKSPRSIPVQLAR